jgi:hypothetical protein
VTFGERHRNGPLGEAGEVEDLGVLVGESEQYGRIAAKV